MPNVTALVPMKHHSQRVPGKNYRVLAGKPLYHHIIEALNSVSQIDEIVVNTDSQVIKDGLSRHFSEVKILDRPEPLRGDEVSMNAIIAHDLSQTSGMHFLQTHSTNPLLKPDTITRAIDLYFEHYPTHDSLFSVTPVHTRLWGEGAEALNHDPSELLQTQDLPPVYEENSCLYLFARESFEKGQNRIGERPFLFPIDRDEAWDIDTELDFRIAACLLDEPSRE